MSTTFVGSLIQALLKILPEDAIKKGVGALLNKIEESVKDSENKIDDAIVLPIVSVIKKQLGIE